MSKTSIAAIALGAFGAALLASAAALNATTIGSAEVSNVDQVGLVCNEYYRRCWRIRGPRYVLRYYYDPSYMRINTLAMNRQRPRNASGRRCKFKSAPAFGSRSQVYSMICSGSGLSCGRLQTPGNGIGRNTREIP
jgi:hypothetical protein